MHLDELNLELKGDSKSLTKDFNKSKFSMSFGTPVNDLFKKIQGYSRQQCLKKNNWPKIDKANVWMLSAETATFMKIGGLGVIASELPMAFNSVYGSEGETATVVTPLYIGNTGKKEAVFDNSIYQGSEHQEIKLKKILSFNVLFFGKTRKYAKNKVDVFIGNLGNVDYIFLSNDRFFSINPHEKNKSTQDGCYVYNEHGVDEVERFAFFSKAIFELLKNIIDKPLLGISSPNILVANDWHLGALAGLCKYKTSAVIYREEPSSQICEKIQNIPIVYIAHHLGYQGWDYDNTSRILNSLYEEDALMIFKNAKAIKNSNPRVENTLIVHDCYNQASHSFHLADKVVTVSRNYLEEVSSELKFGYDFRDILKIRKDHRNFFGIVNGYEKNLISPNEEKIVSINKYFLGTDFKGYDEKSIVNKNHNKKEFIKFLSKLAVDEEYAKEIFPKIELYNFEDISALLKEVNNAPIFSATSRLVEQKGYDIVVQAIFDIYEEGIEKVKPIFILGGAGGKDQFEMLKKLKDDVSKISKAAGKRIFVFHGYRDEFAYSIQFASDFYMMPSKFEPCGLTQMEAMAKGAIPIVTSTGGLVDTVDDNINGFRTEVFFIEKRKVYGPNSSAKRLKNNVNAYREVIEKAIDVFCYDRAKFEEMRKKAMEKNFSWNVEGGSIERYYSLFHTGHI